MNVWDSAEVEEVSDRQLYSVTVLLLDRCRHDSKFKSPPSHPLKNITDDVKESSGLIGH